MTKTRYNPVVSVIIPTYNRAHLLCRAMQSVLNQTYLDFELIIVDDGSTDNTDKIIKEFQEHDKRIKYIRHEKNKGGSAARNSGIKISRGEYIAFLDSDDEWLPRKMEKQEIKFQNALDNVGVIYSGFSCISESSGKIIAKITPTLRGNVYTNLLEGCILGSPTPLIKKICFRKAGFFDETLPSCQDWDMWIRLSKYYAFDFVPDILAKHHIHGSQISVNLNAKIVARKKLVEKYWVDLSRKSKILSILLKRLGILCCLNGDSREGRRYFLGSIKRKPLQKGGYVNFLLSLLVPRIHRNILKKHSVINIDGIKFYY
jgi:glycosyltransferase involved in cell wall biosynthesis